MYSALKQEGQRLYQLAREGLEVEGRSRRCIFIALEIIRFDPERPVLRVRLQQGHVRAHPG